MRKVTILMSVLLLSTVFPVSMYGQIKILYGPYLQNVTATEATVVWEATEPSVGWVEMAPDDGTNFYLIERPKYYDCTNGVKNTSLLHSVKITGLQPGTKYRYRIFSQQVLSHNGIFVTYDGRIAASNVHTKTPPSFQTLDATKPKTSFLVLNDIHGRSDMVEKLSELAKHKEKDMIFFNGDMVSMSRQKEDYFNGFMNTSVNLFAQRKSPYYCRGNHETRGQFATHFQEYFSPRVPNLYFTLRQGPVFFIILDTGEDKPDSDIEYGGIVDYDTYRSEQAIWLKTVQDDPDFKSAKFRVVIGHIPTTTLSYKSWHGEKECTDKFTPILNQMGIDLMICGHTHSDAFHEPNEQIHYPVLVNSNNGVVDAKADARELKVKVIHDDGKTYIEKTFSAQR